MKILSFGSLNIDNVYNVDHFVAPGETMSSLNLEKFCGGKGLNQSISLARAGVDVYHAGRVGTDGQMLIDRLLESGVNVDLLETIEGPSGHAIIQVNKKGQNCIILFGGSNMQIEKDYIDRVLSNFEAGDMMLIQNEINNLDYLMEKAYDRGLSIALNPSPFNDALLSCPLDKVEYFILNEIEGNQISDKTEPKEIIDTIMTKYPNSKVILTLGKDGVMYCDGKDYYTHGIYDVKVVDTTAAGDTFTGFTLAGISEKMDPDMVLEMASKASSLAVNIKGASNSIPTRKMVAETDIVLEDRFLK